MRRQLVTAVAAAAGLALAAVLTWTSLRSPAIGPALFSPAIGPGAALPTVRGLRHGRDELRALIDDPARLQAHIRELTRTSSLAGSEASMHQVEYVEGFWRNLSFKVVRRTYEVPMSYFNTSEQPQPSVSICRRNSDDSEDCSPLELDKPLTAEDSGIIGLSRTFYTFSKPLSGDFSLLMLEEVADKEGAELEAALSGSLVLVPGNETSSMEALMRKAANLTTGFLLIHTTQGVEDVTNSGNSTEPDEAAPAYPNGTGSPDTAVTFHQGLDDFVGDPSTPGYPSLWYALRRAPKDGWESALNATVVPISQADAARLLEEFGAPDVRRSQLFLRVHWPLRFGYRQVHDSCAEVPGAVEPDRVVLLGSHRDAWYGGAIDPHTGMATMLETGRALSEIMKKRQWRPRRTILMCAWDAEEIGLVGSVEWVEEEYQRAGARLVAYLNTDTDVMGNWKILVQASEQMVDTIRDIMSETPNPTLSLTGLPPEAPYFFFVALDESSDYFPFTRALGVPACDLSYIRGSREALVLYDLYHTRYETMRLYRMLDPGGLAHRGLTKAMAAIFYTFAESPVLPLNMSAFGESLRKRFANIAVSGEEGEVDPPTEGELPPPKTLGNATGTEPEPQLLDVLRSALENATRSLERFELRRLALAGDAAAQPLELRMLNDKIMQVQKAFTHHCVFPCEGTSVNLLNGVSADLASLEKVMQAILLGLSSVSKILENSFVL